MKYKKTLLAVLLVTIILVPARPEVSAAFWHLRHGFTAEADGITFKVPFCYRRLEHYASPSDSSLFLINKPGFFRSVFTSSGQADYAIFYISANSLPAAGRTHEMIIDSLSKTYLRGDYKKTAERTLTLAGQPGRCVEFTFFLMHTEKHQSDNSVTIFCRFGDSAQAEFDGTPKTVSDFYDILQTAKPAMR